MRGKQETIWETRGSILFCFECRLWRETEPPGRIGWKRDRAGEISALRVDWWHNGEQSGGSGSPLRYRTGGEGIIGAPTEGRLMVWRCRYGVIPAVLTWLCDNDWSHPRCSWVDLLAGSRQQRCVANTTLTSQRIISPVVSKQAPCDVSGSTACRLLLHPRSKETFLFKAPKVQTEERKKTFRCVAKINYIFWKLICFKWSHRHGTILFSFFFLF